VPTHRDREIGTKVDPFDDRCVGMTQEFDVGDTDDPIAPALLVATDRGCLVGRHRGDTGFAVRREYVSDPLALHGPAGHRGSGAVLHVVGMRYDLEPRSQSSGNRS